MTVTFGSTTFDIERGAVCPTHVGPGCEVELIGPAVLADSWTLIGAGSDPVLERWPDGARVRLRGQSVHVLGEVRLG